MVDKKQEQTGSIFGFKWGTKRATYDSEIVKKKHLEWSISRYFGTEESLRNFIVRYNGKKFLDAGCGNGLTASTLFNKEINKFDYCGVDIAEDAVKTAKVRFEEEEMNGRFVIDNIENMDMGETFDIIMSSGVIHHTSNPQVTFLNLVKHLNPGGTLFFYIYKEKAPIREFCDDYIRNKIANLDDEKAWEKLMQLTKFGEILGDLNIEITLKEPVEIMEIPAGKHNLQRLLYWYFFKAYYDPNYSLDEMNHINFDWYRPLNCFRFTTNEIQRWLDSADLITKWFNPEKSGISVRAEKPI